MFIKKIKKKNGRTKKIYEYLHLVESVRTKDGPRQRLILNLGPIDIDPAQYGTLAKRIESILTGQKLLYELDNTIEKHARNAARQIFKKQAEEISLEEKTDFQNVDINSLEIQNPRSIGAEYICHSIWQELKLDNFFITHEVSINVIPLLKALVIGRLIEPASERHTQSWVENRSALYELTGNPLRSSLSSYYRGGDKIFALIDELEKYLSSREKDIFNLSEKMYFFDLTNSYFEGRAMANPKAKRGRSKEKRNDCKLITLGMIIDEMGFSKYSKIFPGNQSEPEILEGMIDELKINVPANGKKLTIVMDAGIATKKNIELLQEKGCHYIVVSRGKVNFEIDYKDMQVIKENTTKDVKIEVKRFENNGEAYILCRSNQKKNKEEGIRSRAENIFIEKLQYYKDGLAKPRRIKNYEKVIEVIGRLKEKYPKVAKLYQIDIIPEKNKSVSDKTLCAENIEWRKKEELYDKEIDSEGSYILRTDRSDLNDKEIWETYVMLTGIENSFKCMKSYLGLRPNFHQIEDRVDAHMFISVLAYHILNIIETCLQQKGDNRTWATIRDVMKTHERMTISFKSKDEQGLISKQFIRINSTLEPEQLEIYRKLNLNFVPLPKKKLQQQV